jgi:hypothetical protein
MNATTFKAPSADAYPIFAWHSSRSGNLPINKPVTPLHDAQLGGYFLSNRPATPLTSPSCAPGRVLYFCLEPTERFHHEGQGKAHHSPEQPKLRRHGDDFQWWQAPSTMRHGNECANLNSLGAWSHWIPLVPLQGTMLAERADAIVPGLPGHRFAQPWARVFQPVGPMQGVSKGDMPSGPVPGASKMNRNQENSFSLLVELMNYVPNGDRDSSPGLREPKATDALGQAGPVFISSRPEGAREALIHS